MDFGGPGASAMVLRAVAVHLLSAWGDPDSCLVIERASRTRGRLRDPERPLRQPPGGRRRADVPVDWVRPIEAPETAYVGRRRAAVPVDASVQAAPAEIHPKVDVAPEPVRELDTQAIDLALSALEPVDHTTSFEHEPTTPLPMLRAEPPAPGGKRRAVRRAGGRGPFVKGFVSAPVLVGIAALAVSIGGVVTVNDASPASTATATDSHVAASALGGASGISHFSARNPVVTRGGGRDGQPSGTSGQDQLQAAAQGAADERSQALQGINGKADSHDKYLAKNLWIYPLEPVILTARFGDSAPSGRTATPASTSRPRPAPRSTRSPTARHRGRLRRRLRQPDHRDPRRRHRALVLPPDRVRSPPGDTVAPGEVIGYGRLHRQRHRPAPAPRGPPRRRRPGRPLHRACSRHGLS